jgi:hypothetical protein
MKFYRYMIEDYIQRSNQIGMAFKSISPGGFLMTKIISYILILVCHSLESYSNEKKFTL